jgi:hypothetical protein
LEIYKFLRNKKPSPMGEGGAEGDESGAAGGRDFAIVSGENALEKSGLSLRQRQTAEIYRFPMGT